MLEGNVKFAGRWCAGAELSERCVWDVWIELCSVGVSAELSSLGARGTLARLPHRSSNEIMTSKPVTDKLFAPEDSIHSFQ